MDLTFAHPAGLWALLALPAVLAIHFLQREARSVLTSTLFLFEQLSPISASGRRFERLRSSLSLWLQIVAVLLLTWLLVEPRWLRPESSQRVAVVLDSSVSMLPFRAAALQALARRLPALAHAAGTTEWRVFETDATQPTLYAGLSLPAALAALSHWQPRLGTHDFRPALETAQSLVRRSSGLALFVTDRPPPELPDNVALLAVGEPLDNCGFAGLSIEDGVWRALVKNYAATTQTRAWHIEAGGASSPAEQLTLAPGQTRTLSGPLPAGAADRLDLVLSPDAFPLDDRLPILRPQPKELGISVLPLTGLDVFLKRFVASIADAAAVETGADLRLSVNEPVGTGAAIVFATQEVTATNYLGGEIVAASHPLTAGLSWNGLLARETPTVPTRPGDETLVWQGDRSLIFLRGGGANRALYINFDLRQANADRLPAFVVLLHRFVESVRAEKIAPQRLNVETNERLAIASNPAEGPLRNSAGGSPARAPAAPGFFTVTQGTQPLLTAAAAFADPREADFQDAVTTDTLEGKSAQLAERHSRADFLAPAWALLLGAVCLGNWAATGAPGRPERDFP